MRTAIYRTHTRSRGPGTPDIVIDAADLERIASQIDRQARVGSPIALTVGHGTDCPAPHKPVVIGSYSAPQIHYSRDGSAILTAEERIDPAHQAMARHWPGRSVELVNSSKTLHLVAALPSNIEPFFSPAELNIEDSAMLAYTKSGPREYVPSSLTHEHSNAGAVYQDLNGQALRRYANAQSLQGQPMRDIPRGEVARRGVSNLNKAYQLDQRRRDEIAQNNLPDFVEQAQILSNGICALRDILGQLCQGSAMNGSLPSPGPWPTNPSELGFDERQAELTTGTDQYGFDRRPCGYGYPDDIYGRVRSIPGGLPVPDGRWVDTFTPTSATAVSDRLTQMFADYRS